MKDKIQKRFKYGGLTVTATVSVLAIGITVVNNLFKPEFLNNLLREGKGEMILNVVAGIGLLVLTALVTGLAISNHKKPELLQKRIGNLEGENQDLEGKNQTLTTANEKLEGENQTLTTANEKLEGENQTLTTANQGLKQSQTENEQLKKDKEGLKNENKAIECKYTSLKQAIEKPSATLENVKATLDQTRTM